MTETYTKEDFDEDCPRFIPMQYSSEIFENGKSISWYIFDTEKLDFLDDIIPYYDIKDCENACNILNGVNYILNGGSVMTKPKRFTIIHLGNPYDFVVKDHNTNRTYGTFQGDDDSLEECLNNIADENDQLKKVIESFFLTDQVNYSRLIKFVKC